MAKGHQSSASKATRKKNARKAEQKAVAAELPLPKPEKSHKKQKGKGKQLEPPRKKVYIPPTKPAPIRPDPLDAPGVAQRLPPDLLVILRRLGKKDSVTKKRALDELHAFVNTALTEHDEYIEESLLDILPIWLHHLPVLLLHASRRLRLQTASLHVRLLRVPGFQEALSQRLSNDYVGEGSSQQDVLGAWALASCDIDRNVSRTAREIWNNVLTMDASMSERLLPFVRRTIFETDQLWKDLNPGFIPPSEGRERSTFEAEEEEESDRVGRLRFSAMSVLKWIFDCSPDAPDILRDVLLENELWSSLSCSKDPPFSSSNYGFEQPGVRKTAWSLVQSLLPSSDLVVALLPIISAPVMRSAWIESDVAVQGILREPLLKLLTQHPRMWLLAGEGESPEHQEYDTDSGAESDEGTVVPETPLDISSTPGYEEFLQFLSDGCLGSPLQGYPTIVIVLSTLPPSVYAHRHSMNLLYEGFWGALKSRSLNALDRLPASTALVSAALESLLFLFRRMRKIGGEVELPKDEQVAFVKDQFTRLWRETAKGTLKSHTHNTGKIIAQTLIGLQALDAALISESWPAIHELTFSLKKEQLFAIIPLLRAVLDHLPDDPMGLRSVAASTCSTLALRLVEHLGQVVSEPSETKGKEVALFCLDHFGDLVIRDAQALKIIDHEFAQNIRSILLHSPSLIVVYVKLRSKDSNRANEFWSSVLTLMALDMGSVEVAADVCACLLDAVDDKVLPSSLRPDASAIRSISGLLDSLLAAGLYGGNQRALSVLQRMLIHSDVFMQHSTAQQLIEQVTALVVAGHWHLLRPNEASDTAFLVPALVFLSEIFTKKTSFLHPELSKSLLPVIFVMSQLASQELKEHTERFWMKWRRNAPQTLLTEVRKEIAKEFRELEADVSCAISSESISRAAQRELAMDDTDVVQALFPTPEEMKRQLESLDSNPSNPALAALDLLVTSEESSSSQLSASFDPFGLSSYGRIVTGLLSVLSIDRGSARKHAWALQHLIAFDNAAMDKMNAPNSSSTVFSNLSRDDRDRYHDQIEKILAYLLSSGEESGWHATFTTAVTQRLDRQPRSVLSSVTDTVIMQIFDSSVKCDTARDSRILRTVLGYKLSGITIDEGNLWVTIARKCERISPKTTIAVLEKVNEHCPRAPKLHRYRNELASTVLSIHPDKADTDGLRNLQLLVATIPDPDSDIAFLQDQRAVNFIRGCQQWISKAEDLSDMAMESMTLAFTALVPIVQNVSGAHWDLMFDVLENNLENCSLDDDSTIAMLIRSIHLFSAVEDVSSRNKSLKALWSEHRNAVLVLLRDLVMKQSENYTASFARSLARELLIGIVRSLPLSLIDHETFSRLCHLVDDPSNDVRKMAYSLLREAAQVRTQYIVVEAAVDTAESFTCEIPAQLLSLLEQDVSSEDVTKQQLFTNLLACLLLFDLFTDTSLKVKAGYTEQIRNRDWIPRFMMPNILAILDVRGGHQLLKLDMWAVDEFYVDYFDEKEDTSIQLLAAHVYYRALLTLPSLVASWWKDCKDRGLSMAVSALTAAYFSPVLVQAELDRVRYPVSADDLADDSLEIKVLSAINEVVARYLVDEQKMEIAIKIPTEFPLRDIEVRDVQRIGVAENKWRAWLFAVQQTVTAQNGRIVDGLTLFKKNVALHFEGQVECAICYSIISVTDRSLPTKPCRTCKNRFHASCLYKWFHTSHASTCPLCRSDIL